MNDLFENLLNENRCQKNGICSTNPILNAIDTVILNEIRQIAFYVVRLKEFNLINMEIMKQAICALSVTISDTSFNENSLKEFYLSVANLKNEIKNFYVEKCKGLNISYELVTPIFSINDKSLKVSDLIKGGENILRQLYNKTKEEKIRLINLIVLCSKMSSVNLTKLACYQEVEADYYFEILRILSLTNNTGTREEKFIRRIKEFSEISYEIEKKLNFERCKKFGKRKTTKIDTSIYEGKSTLVLGNDLDELYNFLEKTKHEDINVYLDPTLLLAPSYPKFLEFKNLKGVFGGKDIEHDFSNFKGTIYATRNCSKDFDTAFRGRIFTTKIIPYDKATKINKDDQRALIEETKKQEGFKKTIKKEEYEFVYDEAKIEHIIKENENRKFLVILGSYDKTIEENFSNHIIINFPIPYETQGVQYAIENIFSKNLSIYFSKCTAEIINTISSILDKNIENIYMSSCINSGINPHIIEALKKDFNIKII